ncbi:MSMEG_0567/Sll0786 family nitrogen starvation N-acetyltransferase [Pseudomonas syringae]|uniref:MSMEG_0567/Sll0786 family nitrogen starvation N-acetyltransferase n=1 Tax=Pseudomonas syringae group TaxID=136849 RepID=UPI00041E43C1|nr:MULTISPECIES: MSMEG_0567/Sll0786 family nitrogen starvation N-acetyltransferase [Pseudomonas syringae group]MCR8719497.1 GNAT family N-acetyltransferase [Pseudomonas syringae]
MSSLAFALVDSTFEPFRAGELLVKPASEHWEKQAYFALRRSVFSDEQQLLAQDKDRHDFQAIAIVALAGNCGISDQVVGAVRIYQPEPGLWFGGRLCVSPAYRRHSMIGTALVNEAVSRAKDLGCKVFRATVQTQNQGYFHGLHWQTLEQLEVLGQPHCLMQADLSSYPLMPRQVPLRALKVACHD